MEKATKKKFVVINGDKLYFIRKRSMEDAIEWANNFCDHSKEVIVRVYDVQLTMN